jgi:hypothetical protein
MTLLLIDETDATLESVNGELLPTDRQRVHLAKVAISTAVAHGQVAYSELARVEDDHEAGERALTELDAALGELQAARTAVRELCGL